MHRTIGIKKVNKGYEKTNFIIFFSNTNRESVFKYISPDFIKNSKFKVGDRVRIINKKDTFSKYINNWSREMFIINRINTSDPVTYNIKYLNTSGKNSFY